MRLALLRIPPYIAERYHAQQRASRRHAEDVVAEMRVIRDEDIAINAEET